jgi:hypothetical protein
MRARMGFSATWPLWMTGSAARSRCAAQPLECAEPGARGTAERGLEFLSFKGHVEGHKETAR